MENINVGGIKIQHLNKHVQLPEIFLFLENTLIPKWLNRLRDTLKYKSSFMY